MTEESSEPPFTLSVWPDFQAPWWQLHLGYSSATPDLQFVTTGLLSLEGLNQSLSAQDGFSAVAAARALLMGDPTRLSTNTWFRDDGQNASALFELPGSAEAAVLEDRRAATKRIAGLLLLPEPVMAPGGFGGGRATVGIDFGTTNTAIYMQLGSQEPIPMLIQPRHILAYRLAEQSRDQLDAELLPVNPVEVPFQTILRDRLKTLGGQRRPFRDTLIYFAQRRMAAIKTAVGETHDLFANLKWANDQPARERIQLFLTQAVMLALVEAGARGVEPGELSFRFSFPEAFRPAQLESFKAAARNAVRLGQLFVSNPAEQGTPSVTPEPTFETESVATAQYFIHRLSTPSTEGLVTFDIGGHTTDVAVVQSQSLSAEHLAWRGSFQLAGQHLLINHLRQNRGILDQLAAQQPQLADLLSITPERGTASPEAQTLAIELFASSLFGVGSDSQSRG
jgi:hypothetical protein